METAFPIAQSMGRSLSSSLFDPLSVALDKFFDALFTLRMPRANVTESADEVESARAAPGLEKSDCSTKADGKVLTVSAEKESSISEGNEKATHCREYDYTSFNKLPGIRADLITDSFSAHQGMEDNDMNVLCLGGLVTGTAMAWELVETFFRARFEKAKRFDRRLAKVATLERSPKITSKSTSIIELRRLRFRSVES